MEAYLNKASWAVGVPVAIAFSATLVDNLTDEAKYNEMITAWNQPSMLGQAIGQLAGINQSSLTAAEYVHAIVAQDYVIANITFSQDYLIYTIGYFLALFGLILTLMGYNLLKMYGLDADINYIVKQFVDWFTVPPASNTSEEDTSNSASADSTA